MLTFISCVALAGQPEASLALAFGFVGGLGASGRQTLAAGVTVGAAWWFAPEIAVEVRIAAWPRFGTGDWRPITQDGLGEDTARVLTEISHLDVSFLAWLRFSPLRGQLQCGRQQLPISLDFALGTGAVRTTDDLHAPQAEGDPMAEATQRQLHLAFGVSAGFRVGGRLGLRVDGVWLRYTEVVAGTILENKAPASLQVGVHDSPSPRAEKPRRR